MDHKLQISKGKTLYERPANTCRINDSRDKKNVVSDVKAHANKQNINVSLKLKLLRLSYYNITEFYQDVSIYSASLENIYQCTLREIV